jgi:ribosomal protein S18 acetylase RimI-like enzyme
VSYPYVIEPLSSSHERARFVSGVEPLDSYFHIRVTQDIRRRMTACFVAVESATREVAGYYTVAPSGIPLDERDAGLRSRLPRYPLVPAIRLGRLAVSRAHQGKELGATLLTNALARAIRSELTAYAMVVDAKNAAAVAFYRHHGFLAFENVPNTLYLPLAEASKRLSPT